MNKPRVLLSNDDGITAPGLRALAAALNADGFCTFAVSAPSGERSAQSHCITVGKHLHTWELPVEGAEEAYAVEGTPADSVMIALYGPLLRNPGFNLVVSGINRGDNCGLHVIYSGTVGAAREAACKDVPAIAVSLDNYLARTEEQYAAAATYCVALMKAGPGMCCGTTCSGRGGAGLCAAAALGCRVSALPSLFAPLLHAMTPGCWLPNRAMSVQAVLGVLPPPRSWAWPAGGASLAASLAGQVINVNVPQGAVGDVRGYYLAHQGQHCHFPNWTELEADGHVKEGHAGGVTLRAFRNAAGSLRGDATEGSDSWAVSQGYVAVTPVGLRSDLPLTVAAATQRVQPRALHALSTALVTAAGHLGAQAGGIPKEVVSAAAAAAEAAGAAASPLAAGVIAAANAAC